MVTRRKGAVAQDRRMARPQTLEDDFVAQLDAMLERLNTMHWPSSRWRADPVGFARDVLGLTLKRHQKEILEAIRDHKKVAVRSGNKAGKTMTIICAALWFFCSFPDARVVMTATTAHQVDGVLWRQLRAILMKALLVVDTDGNCGDKARTGMRAADLREVTGHTVKEIEAISGVSGANIFYIVDEASSLSQKILDAIEGNRAGGLEARIVMISNPTRNEGPFFDAFHKKKLFWHTIHINCEDVARENADRTPGLADASTQEEWARDYGLESVFYRVRVKGEFCVNEAGKAIPYALIAASQERWEDTEAEGLLTVGLDPAGPGDGGDDTCFAVRRGLKLLDLVATAGLTEDAIIVRLLAILREHRAKDERPRVILDAEGPIGGSLLGRLLAISRGAKAGHDFDVYGVRASHHAHREPLIFDRVRDELFASLAKWLKSGGAIPQDPLLETELHAPNWVGQVNGKLKLTPKPELRKLLGRSPDRADALALAVWEPIALVGGEDDAPAPAREHEEVQDEVAEFDQQGANDEWWPSGALPLAA